MLDIFISTPLLPLYTNLRVFNLLSLYLLFYNFFCKGCFIFTRKNKIKTKRKITKKII